MEILAFRSGEAVMQRCRTDDLRVLTDQNDGNPMRLIGTAGNHLDLCKVCVGMITYLEV